MKYTEYTIVTMGILITNNRLSSALKQTGIDINQITTYNNYLIIIVVLDAI